MTRKDVIFQLNDLKRDAMSHFTDDGDDDIFRADVEALDAAIEALKEQPAKDIDVPTNRWISVKDKLPRCGDRVIMTDGVFVCEAFLSISGKWVRNGIGWIASEITHWMPMPSTEGIKDDT